MGYWSQFAIWTAVALLPLLINFAACRITRIRHGDEVGLAGMLVIFWALYNFVIVSPPGQPQNMLPLAFLDLMGVGIAMAAWWTIRRPYKLALASVFVFQLAAHAAFWWARRAAGDVWSAEEAGGALHLYKSILNIGFAFQAVIVAWPGGGALVRHGFDLLPHRGRFHRHLGSGSGR